MYTSRNKENKLGCFTKHILHYPIYKVNQKYDSQLIDVLLLGVFSTIFGYSYNVEFFFKSTFYFAGITFPNKEFNGISLLYTIISHQLFRKLLKITIPFLKKNSHPCYKQVDTLSLQTFLENPAKFNFVSAFVFESVIFV